MRARGGAGRRDAFGKVFVGDAAAVSLRLQVGGKERGREGGLVVFDKWCLYWWYWTGRWTGGVGARRVGAPGGPAERTLLWRLLLAFCGLVDGVVSLAMRWVIEV